MAGSPCPNCPPESRNYVFGSWNYCPRCGAAIQWVERAGKDTAIIYRGGYGDPKPRAEPAPSPAPKQNPGEIRPSDWRP